MRRKEHRRRPYRRLRKMSSAVLPNIIGML
ncbi:hypothetical protein TNCV_2527741, partial [Trichonephila clavipes]